MKGNPIGAKDPTGHDAFTVAREYDNTHLPRKAETAGKNLYLVEENDVRNGLGLSKLAEKTLQAEGEKLTNENVKNKMHEILKNNPSAFGKNKSIKANSLLKVGNYTAENPNAPDLFDSLIGTPTKGVKLFKWGKLAYEKLIKKDNETEEIKQLRGKVKDNADKIFDQYENRLQKLGIQTRTKGFPYNIYNEEGKPYLTPDVNSKGNIIFKGAQREIIITNDNASKIK